MNVCSVHLVFTPARLDMNWKVVLLLLSPLARKCKDEFSDFINIRLADFFMDKTA